MLRVDFTGSVGAVTCSKESDLAFTTGMVGKAILVRFNEEWEGLEVLISFWNDVDKMTIEIGTAPVNEYLEVEVPWEILLNENKPLKIGAYGYTVNGQYIVTAIPTIWELLGYIRRGADGNGEEPGPDPTVHIGSDDVVAIANGGTAARTAEEARRKLGITFENIIGEGSGVVPIAKGGTGGATAKDALFMLHGWDLDEGTEISAGSDLDDIVAIGTYYCTHENKDSVDNTPFDSDNSVEKSGFKMMVNEYGTGAKFQILFASKNEPIVYVRSYGDDEWHSWVKLLSTRNAVSISQGGTGSTTAAEAREALGITLANILGSAVVQVNQGGTGANTAAGARYNLVVPTYATLWPSQTTIKVLRDIDGNTMYPIIGTHLINSNDKEPSEGSNPLTANNILHSGFYYINTNSPKTGLPKDPDYDDAHQANYGFLLTLCYGTPFAQIFFDVSHNRFYMRVWNGNTGTSPSNWLRVGGTAITETRS